MTVFTANITSQFTSSTKPEEMINVTKTIIDSFPSASLEVKGYNINAGELVGRIINNIIKPPSWEGPGKNGTPVFKKVNNIIAKINDKSIADIANLFSMRDIKDTEDYYGEKLKSPKIIKLEAMGLCFEVDNNYAPNQCIIRKEINGHYVYVSRYNMIKEKQTDHTLQVRRDIEAILHKDEAISFCQNYNETIIFYITPSRVFDYIIRADITKISNTEYAYLIEQIEDLIKTKRLENKTHKKSHKILLSEEMALLQYELQTKYKTRLASEMLELEIVYGNNWKIWLRLNKIDENNKITKGKILDLHYTYYSNYRRAKMVEGFEAYLNLITKDKQYTVSLMLKAYLSKNHPENAENIIEMAQERVLETWNVLNEKGGGSPLWIKVQKGRICGNFPLTPNVVWHYDRLVLKKNFFDNLPESIFSSLESPENYGKPLAKYIKIKAIPGMEDIKIKKINRKKGGLSITLDMDA